MKTGKTLSQLAAEIERQSTAKQDFVADTRKLEIRPIYAGPLAGADVDVATPHLVIKNGSDTILPIGPLAHRQIGERVQIPAKYYDRMLSSAPDRSPRRERESLV